MVAHIAKEEKTKMECGKRVIQEIWKISHQITQCGKTILERKTLFPNDASQNYNDTRNATSTTHVRAKQLVLRATRYPNMVATIPM